MAVPEERTGQAVRQQIGDATITPPLPFALSGTPNAQRKNGSISLVRSMLLGAGLALGAYFLMSRFLSTVPRARLGAVGKLGRFLCVLVAAAVAPLAHEIGHVLGGRIVRFRFTLLVWGPLRVAREGNQVRVGLNRNGALVGGIALSLPTTMEDLARRTLVVVAMGPVTSVALGLASLAVSYLTGIWRTPTAMADPSLAIGGIALGAFGVSSLGIGLLTLLPGRTGRFATDGSQILRYLRGGVEAERHSELMTLVALASGGTRPRDWPRALIQRLTTDRFTSSDSILGELFAYYQALDDGDFSGAHGALSTVLERAGSTGRKARAPYAQEAAFYELTVHGDTAAAERWLDEELTVGIADVSMRKVLVNLLTLTKVVEVGQSTAAATARSRVDEALPLLAGRSGVDAVKTELIARRVDELA
jgi:hypothetical protein